jgi:hypothetical protein
MWLLSFHANDVLVLASAFHRFSARKQLSIPTDIEF